MGTFIKNKQLFVVVRTASIVRTTVRTKVLTVPRTDRSQSIPSPPTSNLKYVNYSNMDLRVWILKYFKAPYDYTKYGS